MSHVISGVLQITDDTFVTPILIYGTRYMLAVTEVWNAHFKLIDDARMDELRKRVLSFDFKAAQAALKDALSGTDNSV
jgi:hypothetical protein